jgi:hypothetical protein
MAAAREAKRMMELEILVLGLAVGLLVGLMGVGGGVVLVPALVFLLGMTQHMAQGTSLFLQLPPIGLAALYTYWKRQNVDVAAGLVCAAGFLFGGYFGGRIALAIPSRELHGMFGVFLMFAAAMLYRQSSGVRRASASGETSGGNDE